MYHTVALRKESVDRNRVVALAALLALGSLSARRAWIEIAGWPCPAGPAPVALRKESVDRNRLQAVGVHGAQVALRKESVDRNDFAGQIQQAGRVALRKESVDRNLRLNAADIGLVKVALRKESVDRNRA